jgi:hypothetical protein
MTGVTTPRGTWVPISRVIRLMGVSAPTHRPQPIITQPAGAVFSRKPPAVRSEVTIF